MMRNVRLVLFVITVVIVVAVAYRTRHPASTRTTHETGSLYDLEVRSIPVTHNLALGEFEVPARSTHETKVTLDEPHMRNARLSGHFSTSSPSGIQVMLLDEIQHNRFLNHSAPSEFLYLSKTVASGNIEAMIPHGGAYYLIFDNSASDSSVKVKADVTVRYETVQVDSQGKLR